MTRKENLIKCKGLLYGGIINQPLSETDSNYLVTQIFPLHKRWEEKRAGKKVKQVIVHTHKMYNNKCFALVLEDGEIVDISFLECINRPGLVKDIETACMSIVDSDKKIKPIIVNWLKTFDNEELSVGKFLTDTGEGVKFNNDDIITSFKKFYEENV